MDSPWLMAVYSLAYRLGESDPRKISSLPADILLHWQAWLSLTGNTVKEIHAKMAVSIPPAPDTAGQCADVMRILGR